MLKLFFNRSSLFIRILNLVSLLLAILILKNRVISPYLFLLFGWFFLHMCVWIRWYPAGSRGRGIEVHFRKALVPAVYMVASASLFHLRPVPFLTFSVVAFANFIVGILVAINVILIYFHLRDKDPMPVNFFSANRYLHEEFPTSGT